MKSSLYTLLTLKFKSEQLQKEYLVLKEKNPELVALIEELNVFTSVNFKKALTITHVYRTAQEHAELYKNTPLERRPKTSPHMYWHAVDLRALDFLPSEREQMLYMLNSKIINNLYSPLSLCHQIAGNVLHFHIQYKNGGEFSA